MRNVHITIGSQLSWHSMCDTLSSCTSVDFNSFRRRACSPIHSALWPCTTSMIGAGHDQTHSQKYVCCQLSELAQWFSQHFHYLCKRVLELVRQVQAQPGHFQLTCLTQCYLCFSCGCSGSHTELQLLPYDWLWTCKRALVGSISYCDYVPVRR